MDETPQQNPVNYQESPEVVSTPPSTSKFPVILLVVLGLVLIAAVSFGAYYFSFKQEDSLVISVNPDNTVPEILPFDDPDLIEYGIYYSFKTKLLQVKQSQDDIELKIALKNEHLPGTLFVGENTLTFSRPPGEPAVWVPPSSLTVGQEVIVILLYDRKAQEWTTRSVVIQDGFSDNASTPSAVSN